MCGAQYGRRDRLFTRLPIYLSMNPRVDSSTGLPVYSFTGLLDYEFSRRLVYGSTCLLAYRFTHLRVLASTRLRVRLFTRLPVYLSTSSRVDSFTGPRVYSSTGLLICEFPRRRRHNCPRTAGRICASSSTTRARSKPSRITARMVSSPAIVPHRLSGSCASISVVMLVA